MAQIDRWTRHADHIIGHTDEIEHLYHWDTLSVSNLCINIDEWPFTPPDVSNTKRPLRILHAPNHRHIKGSQWFIDTIDELRAEGIALEFVILEGVPNNQVKEVMKSVDVIADQLLLGWHGMFALEAMAMGKPVLCYLREDLLEFFMVAGLLQPGELPIINCNPLTVKEIIRDLALNREQLIGIGNRSRKYVVEHHSLEAIGAVFDQIMRSLEITPGDAPQ